MSGALPSDPREVLTQEQLARLAAQEVRDGDQVWLDPELAGMIARHLPAGVTAVERNGTSAPLDHALISATRFFGSEGGLAPGGVAEHFAHARRKILVMLPDAPISVGDLLTQAVHATNGHAVDRIVAGFGVVDLTQEGPVLRQLAPNISARDVQAQTQVELLAGPDLCEVTL